MVALLGAVSFTVWQNFNIVSPDKLVEALPEHVDVAFDNVDYTETRGDKRFWRLQADSVAHQAQRKEARLKNVRMTFYEQGEFGDVHLTAQHGQWFSETGNIELNGDVTVKSSQGQKLFCDQLSYDNAAEIIASESAVRLVAEGMEVRGRGLKVFLQQQRIVVLGQVQTWLSN